jgi:hypothetical protein
MEFGDDTGQPRSYPSELGQSPFFDEAPDVGALPLDRMGGSIVGPYFERELACEIEKPRHLAKTLRYACPIEPRNHMEHAPGTGWPFPSSPTLREESSRDGDRGFWPRGRAS